MFRQLPRTDLDRATDRAANPPTVKAGRKGRGPLCRRSPSKFSWGNGATQSRIRWSPIRALSENDWGISAGSRMTEPQHHVGAPLDWLVEENPLRIVLSVLADRSGSHHLLGSAPLATDVDGGSRDSERLQRLIARPEMDYHRHDRPRVPRFLRRCFLTHRMPTVRKIVQQCLAGPLQAVSTLTPLDHPAVNERVFEAGEQVGRQCPAVELELCVVAIGETQPIRATVRAGNIVGALEVPVSSTWTVDATLRNRF
jgi:hypothetical protein